METNKYIESDKDIANDINPLIEEGILVVNTPQEENYFIELIESNFAFVGSKIDFDLAHSMVESVNFRKLNDQQIASIVQRQILKEGEKFNLLERKFAIIGDNYMDYSYSGVLKKVIPHISVFISLPQHTYLISEDGRFVFCYTFEDDFLFYIAH